MAIGTRDEQFSMMLLDMPFGRVLPNPNGGFGTAKQMQFLRKFSSDISGAVVAVFRRMIDVHTRTRIVDPKG